MIRQGGVMKRTILGIMGPGPGATVEDIENAYELGRLTASRGWVLLTGGMAAGVMDAANRGAKEAGGLTLGILPTSDAADASEAVDIAVVTGMGSARNNINVLTSDVVIACGIGPGTASEIALALKAGRDVILLGGTSESRAFFADLSPGRVRVAGSPEEAIRTAAGILGSSSASGC